MPYPGPQQAASELPVSAVLPAIENAVSVGSLVLTAAPGAGKSSLVPFAVDEAIRRVDPDAGRVMLLQPRRLAARATAARLAELIGEPVGQSVGITMRGEHKKGRRIEVVTEAILTRRLQADPELSGIGAVIFDEFHERHLHSDLGLAMAIEARDSVRADLRIVVMSATIDPVPIAALLGDATAMDVEGTVFPVETEHRDRPVPAQWATAVANATTDLAGRVAGDVLVFAPGRGEIEDVIRRLPAALSGQAVALHGSSPSAVHRAVLQPSRQRRIIVATGIAETSVTIPGIEAVVDGGLTRRPRFDPATGTNQLVTEHVSRFSADQRRGRAGRTRPGVCIRMWSALDHELLIDQATPEIVDGDPLVVAAELLRWGDPDARHLPLLDHPDRRRLDVARRTMSWWGVTEIDHDQPGDPVHLTELGRAVVSLPVHPRIGALLATVRRTLSAADPLAEIGLRAAGVLEHTTFPTSDDFEAEVQQARGDRDVARSVERLRRAIDAARLPALPVDRPSPTSLAELLALAWPDRIAVRRAPDSHRLLMASGREVALDRGSSLGRAEAFVVVDTTVVEASGRVRRAVPLERSAITGLHPPEHHVSVEWDRRRNRILAERQTRHGAIVLHAEAISDPSPAAVQRAAEDGVRSNGLDVFRWSERSETVRRRMQWLHGLDDSWPDVGDDALLGSLDRWLDLTKVRNVDGLRRIDVGGRLVDLLDWDQRRRFDDLAPLELATPSGRMRRIDWSGDRPVWAVRVQDLFGVDVHPTIGPTDEPLTIELLSPAGRVAQTTTDLPGFWRGSYAAVRADLRGRYPKHAWPEDPTAGVS